MADEDTGSTTAHEEKKHTKQQRMLIVIGVVSLVLVYVMMKRSSSSGSGAQTAAQQSALAQYEAQLASQSYGSQQGAYASNAADPVLMQMLQGIQALQSQVATMQAPGAAPVAAAPTPAKNAGYGEIQTSQGLMAWLGTYSPSGIYSGYEVGGGAPVLFGNAETLSEGFKPGDVYTPVAYEPFISPTTYTGKQG